MDEKLLEMDEQIQDIRENDPERFAELLELQQEWEATPEGRQVMRQAEAAEALEREKEMGVEGSIDGSGQFGL